MKSKNKQYLLSKLRDIPDFPKPGIIFKDITPLLSDPKAFTIILNALVDRYKDKNIDFIAGIESRGFIFGVPLAHRLNIGFIPIRKVGKLPASTYKQAYGLEYGASEVEIHTDAFDEYENANVVLCDDLIATGGSANASLSLIKRAGGNTVESCFIINLDFLNGVKDLTNQNVFTLLDIK